MRAKNRFDALIIGAGPAGATAAFILACNGYKVGIIEKRSFPRFKLCGGLLSQKTVTLLESIFNITVSDLKANGVIHSQSSAFAVRGRNGDCLKGELGFPFHFVDRSRYDLHWLHRAVAAGADVFFEEKAEAVDLADGKISTRSGKQFWAHFIIAADGVFSRIRALLFRRGWINSRRMQDIAEALEIFIPRKPSSDFEDHPSIYFGFTPWGYAWSFPGLRNQTLGLCALKRKLRHPIGKYFNDFLQTQGIARENFSNVKGYALPYGNYLHRAGYHNILLVGDAAGLADPLLGEGIYYAHKSAQLACAAIMKSFEGAQNALQLYYRLLDGSVLTELRYARMFRQILFCLPRRSYFKILTFMLKQAPDKFAETIQGQRSFKLLRPLPPV